jgi:DNA-directed RNA polymerase specialized sigma24 family protein
MFDGFFSCHVRLRTSRCWAGAFSAAAALSLQVRPRQTATEARGVRRRLNLESIDLVSTAAPDEVLVLDELIVKLGNEDPDAAQIVKLRYFAGLSIVEAARLMGISRSTAYEHWAYARGWLRCALVGKDDQDQP